MSSAPDKGCSHAKLRVTLNSVPGSSSTSELAGPLERADRLRPVRDLMQNTTPASDPEPTAAFSDAWPGNTTAKLVEALANPGQPKAVPVAYLCGSNRPGSKRNTLSTGGSLSNASCSVAMKGAQNGRSFPEVKAWVTWANIGVYAAMTCSTKACCKLKLPAMLPEATMPMAPTRALARSVAMA